MKIFQLNDYEWWFAETLEAAYAAALAETGVTREEMDFEPIEIPESEWDKPNMVRLSEDGDPVEMGSYRDALGLATCDGSTSGLLCGTET